MRMTIAERCGSPFKPHLLGGSLAFLVVLWLHTRHLMRRWLTRTFCPQFSSQKFIFLCPQKIKPQFPPTKIHFPPSPKQINPKNFLSSSKHLSSPPSVCRLLNLEAIHLKTGRNRRPPQPHMVPALIDKP
ncbi:hypothetical protein HanRHA438_Chr14g0667891 [Helianthus annuus]|uniref:Uncharacterized protein n=2 Tax=Helianthus annuus TaxID=4232 RepID=A0A9K3H8P4_HELAN|nr:hypothetical protein HanXRQr2_Chr14g0656991 [Helianthus annuus]KAJ0469891.1 hypothetical protein HanIR_Chr14g0712851 [Helianthus annuus]KAJ0486748.1 hypothetical protein HanHA89_Chr14g0583031 [Helianthus annuus]KAJ0660881.1 hypothetical protein HanOQP8_Chr14g0542601 [Helianthus annuus]KAJ0854926.1 hypothetical protein HanRHA438_Chr14g0667891 [Helianthus annuus]